MSDMNKPVFTAEFSGTGKFSCTPAAARREIRAGGSLWLIFGDEPKQKPEIKATAAEEKAIEASDACIAEGMLTDREQMELDEHDAVAIGPALYAYWITDSRGLRWLKPVEAEAPATSIAATSNEAIERYNAIVEQRAKGEDIDAEYGADILDLAGKSMDDFNADVAALIALDMELRFDG